MAKTPWLLHYLKEGLLISFGAGNTDRDYMVYYALTHRASFSLGGGDTLLHNRILCQWDSPLT